MKNFIFGLLAVLLFSMSGFAQTKTSAPKEERIYIKFGRVSKDCGGIGICEFTFQVEVEDIINIITAFFDRNGNLQIKIPAHVYETNKSKFANNSLSIEEDYVVPLAETSKMGRSSSFTIKTGKYPLVFNSSTNTYNCTF